MLKTIDTIPKPSTILKLWFQIPYVRQVKEIPDINVVKINQSIGINFILITS